MRSMITLAIVLLVANVSLACGGRFGGRIFGGNNNQCGTRVQVIGSCGNQTTQTQVPNTHTLFPQATVVEPPQLFHNGPTIAVAPNCNSAGCSSQTTRKFTFVR